MEKVQKTLLDLLEDSKPLKKQASTLLQFAAILVQHEKLADYRNPDKFQHCLTRVKHALKCAAFLKFQQSANADKDTKWAKAHLDPKGANALVELQYWKQRARSCIVQNREERIRWKSNTEMSICTDLSSDTWVDVPLASIAAFIRSLHGEADDIMISMGIQIFTQEELRGLKDPQKMPSGSGMMDANPEFSGDFEELQLPFDNATVLKKCFECGNRIATAISYSGAGTTRTPQMCAISIVEQNAGSSRSLRLLYDQTCIRYTALKQDGLMSKDLAKILKNVLKFAYPELSASIATFIIKVKPLQIKAALLQYGETQARAAGSLLIVNAHCLARTTRNDKVGMLKIVNDFIAKHLPGLQVNELRHGIEGVSKMAARNFVAKNPEDVDKIRSAMIHLSAHGEDTSDAVYAGEENTMFNFTHDDIDLYRLCAKIFNDFIGLTSSQLVQPAATDYTDKSVFADKQNWDVFASPGPCLPAAGSMPTPPTTGRRMQNSQFTAPLSQTTSGGFQWPAPGCISLSGIDENDVSGGGFTEELDLLRADFNQGSDDDQAAGQKRSAGDYNDSPAILPALQMPSLALLLRSPSNRSRPSTPLPPSSATPSQLSTPRPPSPAIISLPSTPHPLTPAIPSQPATPRLLSPQALPVLGPGYEFQADVLVQLRGIVSSGVPGCLLVVQPTSSGKGKYARELAKEPNTLVLLLCPYAKVVQEALDDNPDSVELKDIESGTMSVTLRHRGLLAVSAFEGAPKHRTKLSAIKSQGVRVAVVVDEIHTLQDSKEIVDGYRDFRSFWTLVAGVQPHFVLGLTATLRPRHETAMANACGLQAWGPHSVIRASCRRPAVATSCHVYEDEAAAIQAIVNFRPQLLCVKSKADMEYLQRNSFIKKAYRDVLPHFKELDAIQKVPFFECSLTPNPNPIVITAFTGEGILDPAQRLRSNSGHSHIRHHDRY